jgi:hypothetical protein
MYIRDNLAETPLPSVGDTAWHQRWVNDYATVIVVLQDVLAVCGPTH